MSAVKVIGCPAVGLLGVELTKIVGVYWPSVKEMLGEVAAM